MKNLCVILLSLALLACGGVQHGGARAPLPIDALRARVANAPDDAALVSELAAAELLWEGGDATRARAVIDRALTMRSDDPALHFLSALQHEQQGRLAETFEAELAALEAARTSDAALGPAVAEVLIGYAASRGADVPDHRARLERAMARLVDEPGHAGTPARLAAAWTLAGLLQRRGEAEEATHAAARVGCIQSARVAGPFGATPMIAFDEPVPAEGPGPLADRYELGAERGEAPTRELETALCSFSLGDELDEELRGPGTWVLEARVDVSEAGAHVLEIRTPNVFRAHVDGEQVAGIDRRTVMGPERVYVPLTLDAGAHEIEIVLATRHPNPFVSLTLTRGSSTFDPRRGAEMPADDDALSRYLGALVARRRGDPVGAREQMRTLGEGTATLLISHADVTNDDPFLPDAHAADRARRLLERAARLEPDAWYPRYQAARHEQGARESLALMREAADRYPHIASLQLELASWLGERGRTAEADAYIARAREHVPTSCQGLNAELASLRQRGRAEDADARVDELLACDARSRARLNLLQRQRRWDEAAQELERLTPLLEPEVIRAARIHLATATGDDSTVQRLREEIARENDREFDEHYPFARVDALVARGDRSGALDALAEAIERRPSESGALRRVRRAFGGDDPLFRYRVDGAEAIRRFETSGRSYDDASEVLVLDYMVVRLHEDGSSEELVHQIFRVQTEEAIERLGQISLPGHVLTLRSIKPDGRRLEPDSIAGLDHIEMPSLAIGDYVEFEYLRGTGPGPYRSGGWIFQNFSVPFDLSRLVLVAPQDLPVVIEPRGPVPEPVESREGDMQVLTWTVEESRPLVDEPYSAVSPERLPQLDFGVHAGWDRYFARLVDGLMGQDPRDPAAERLVREILGAHADAPVEARARRLHRWVLENIEDGGRGSIPLQLAARAGNRDRVLRYLLEMAGIEARIVFARALGRRSPMELQRDDVYPAVLVMMRREGESPIFTSAAERGIPFGYINPTLRGQEAVVLEPGHPTVTVGDQSSSDLRDIRAEVTMASDGSARVAIEERFHGMGSYSWRRDLEGIPAAELSRRFEQAYVIPMFGQARLVSLEVEGQQDLDAPLVLRYLAEVPTLGRSAADAHAIAPLFQSGLSRIFARLPTRETTEAVMGAHTRLRLAVRGPGAARVGPDAEIAGPKGARATFRSRTEGDVLIVEREVSIPPMLITPEEYPALTRFCMAADQMEAQEIRVAR